MNVRLFWIGVLACIISSFSSKAQIENVWVFGDSSGVDFNGPVPQPIVTSIKGFGESNAAVCNDDGALLFYTEGSIVWSANHQVMPNGTGLLPFPPASSIEPTSSTAQGCIIIPMPDSSGKYYLFSLSSQEQGVNYGRLYYCVVDMSLNGGQGDVDINRKAILVDTGLSERMTAVLGDHCNIWLLTSSRHMPNVIKAYEITASGINTAPVISGGLALNDTALIGVLQVSPDRKKLVATKIKEDGPVNFGATLYDFDPATGQVSSPIYLLPDSAAYGACFSPDNSKLYINAGGGNLGNQQNYQYDLSSGNTATIAASKTFLGITSTLTQLKAAPNGRIYFITDFGFGGASAIATLGSINAPDLAGTACQYQFNSLQLLPGKTAYLGLPNVVPRFKRDTLINAMHYTVPCFDSGVVLVPTTTGTDYLWSDGSTGSQLTVITSGTYVVTYRDAPCTFYTDTFHVTVNSLAPDIGYRPLLCGGDTNGIAWITPHVADTNTYIYTWKNADGVILQTNSNASLGDTLFNLGAGAYHVTLQAANGCDTTITFDFLQPHYPVSFTTDTLICLGDMLSFQNISDPYFTTFNWDFGDGQTSAAINPTHTYTASGRYTVQLIAEGIVCKDAAELTITVDAPLSPFYFTKEPDHICTGQQIAFHPLSDSTTTGLAWDIDGEIFTTTDYSSFKRAFASPGNYPIQLTAHFRACPDLQYNDSIAVYPLPVVYLGRDTVLCLGGAPVLLQNQSAVLPGARYLWSTGDTTGNISVTHHGIYGLTVTSAEGCTNTENITVNKNCYIDIPNAFTPNGDGENDYFFPRVLLSRSVTAFRMQVFNRWGQIVFRTESVNGRGWDGQFNNKPQPGGVYIYLIDVETNGRAESYKGNVTLLR